MTAPDGERLRVLRVIARMNVGGPALQVVGLADGLDRDRFECRLLVGSVGPDEADYLDLRAPHVEVQRVVGLGRSPNALGDLRAFWSLLVEMRRFRPHIVHTHTAKAGALGRVAARLTGVPIVVHTFHGHLLTGYFSPTVTKVVVLVERTLARATTKLVAVGSQVRDDLVAAGIGTHDQYVIVPPGVALPPVPTRAAARAELGLAEDRQVIAFVARLTSVKRPDRFVDVARAVHATHPRSQFVVVGEGQLLDELRTRAADLGDAVRFLGWRSDVETIYAAADLVLLTSDNEGMPVSLIEAATVGCPAVTTDVGSAREVVAHGETGLVVPTDTAHLADAVRQLLDDPAQLAAMAEQARVRGARLFSRDRLVNDIADLYEELAAGKGLP